MKFLLDYVFPIEVIDTIPAASTGWLKQLCLVVAPKAGQEANVGQVYECVTMAEVEARTDNVEAQQIFNAGMTKVFILLAADLNLTAPMLENVGEFYTVLISSDFEDVELVSAQASLVKGSLTFTAKTAGSDGNDISIEFLDTGAAGAESVIVTTKKISVSMEAGVSTATQMKTAIDASTQAMALLAAVEIASGQGATVQAAFVEDFLENGAGLEVGVFDGVVGVSSEDEDFLADQAAISKRAPFYALDANGAKNMCYAFGSLLSNGTNWQNQQYIEMPFDDAVEELGTAESLFEDKINFVISDDEFGKRLALFAAGGKAIAAPYILKNLRIDLQSRALSWIAANQPAYTKKEATLLETRLQEDVITDYIDVKRWITAGTVEIAIGTSGFTATGAIDVAEPKALWRVISEMRQTL